MIKRTADLSSFQLEIGQPEPSIIWLDPDAGIFTIVDYVDYDRFYRYRWGITFNQNKKKMYATRSTRLQGRSGPQVRVYLHKEVLIACAADTHPKLAGQIIGDHINGNSLDNRRSNLRWATPQENNWRYPAL